MGPLNEQTLRYNELQGKDLRELREELIKLLLKETDKYLEWAYGQDEGFERGEMADFSPKERLIIRIISARFLLKEFEWQSRKTSSSETPVEMFEELQKSSTEDLQEELIKLYLREPGGDISLLGWQCQRHVMPDFSLEQRLRLRIILRSND